MTMPNGNRRLRVLVADDESPVRLLLQEFLEQHGYQVVLAADGREALKVLRCQDFDRVFLDLMMPYLDGLEVLQQTRKLSLKKMPWVAVMTAQADNIDAATREAIGADHLISKPVDLVKLATIL